MFHGIEDVYRATVEDAFVKRGFVSDVVFNLIFVKYYALASAVLLYFDYAITLPDEVRRIWGARLSGATIMFFLNRYVPLFGYIVILASLFNPPWTIEVCNMFAPFPGALNTFSQGIISIILVLRTYTLYGQNIWILLVTTSMGIVNVDIGAWAASAMTGSLFSFKPLVSCVPILQIPQKRCLRYGWIATFAFDFLIFCLTFYRTLRLLKTQSSQRKDATLARLIIRDGSLYFLVMSVVNALNFAFFFKITNALFSSTTGTNSMVAHVVSVCLINRLLLNLRRESSRYNEESNGATSTTVTNTRLVFTTRIMGNLTAELITPSEEEQDAYYYTSGDSRRSTNRFSPSASAYTTGLSFVSVRSNLSRQTGLTDSSSCSQSAIPSVGIASGSGRYSPNAVSSGSGQRGRPPSFSPPSDIETPATAVDETRPFWSSSRKIPLKPLSHHQTTVIEEYVRWEVEDGEVGIEMTRLGVGDAPLPQN